MFRLVETGRVSLGFRTTLGKDRGIDSKRLQQQISNLDRLGILRIEWAESPSTSSEITAIDQLLAPEFPGGNDTASHAGVIRVTPLGEQFLDTCVRVPRRK